MIRVRIEIGDYGNLTKDFMDQLTALEVAMKALAKAKKKRFELKGM